MFLFAHTLCVIPKISRLLTTELPRTRRAPASRWGLCPAAWPGRRCSSARDPRVGWRVSGSRSRISGRLSSRNQDSPSCG